LIFAANHRLDLGLTCVKMLFTNVTLVVVPLLRFVRGDDVLGLCLVPFVLYLQVLEYILLIFQRQVVDGIQVWTVLVYCFSSIVLDSVRVDGV
jgi:hypothetical protein